MGRILVPCCLERCFEDWGWSPLSRLGWGKVAFGSAWFLGCLLAVCYPFSLRWVEYCSIAGFFRYYTVLICFRFRTTYLTGWVKKKIRELVVEPCWALRSVPGLAQRDSPELPGDCWWCWRLTELTRECQQHRVIPGLVASVYILRSYLYREFSNYWNRPLLNFLEEET